MSSIYLYVLRINTMFGFTDSAGQNKEVAVLEEQASKESVSSDMLISLA